MRIPRTFALAAAAAVLCATASAQIGPDVTVSHVGGTGSDYAEFGPTSGHYSYAMATISCNRGDEELEWIDSGPLATHHPVISQTAYKLEDGVLRQVGYAWLKHGFCALSQNLCGTCQANGTCDYLGIGCADTYGSGLNSSGLKDRFSSVNPASGVLTPPYIGASGVHAGRVVVDAADVAVPGARYFFESQYVASDDSAAGNHANNCSYREVRFNNPTSITSVSLTVQEDPAIRAWEAEDPNAVVDTTIVPDEGGVGVHGIYNVAFRITDNGDGTFHYEYAVHNQTSQRGAGSVSIPVPAGVVLSNVSFYDIDHHSGSPIDNTDWTWSHSGGELTWQTVQDHATNPDGNSIRWGFMYNFSFDANVGPTNGQVTIGLFEPGTPTEIFSDARVPAAPSEPGAAVCFGDGTGIACPCGNDSGTPGRGCVQSNGVGMRIQGFGSSSISADDFGLTTSSIAPGNSCIYYCGTAAIQQTLFDGIQCVGGDVRRFGGQFQNGGSVTSSGFVAQEGTGAYFTPGTTYQFQLWSRDVQNPTTPCNTFANLSPGYSITMTP